LRIIRELPIRYTSSLNMAPQPAGSIPESGLDLRPLLAVFSKIDLETFLALAD